MTSPVRDALELSKQQFHILTTADAQELGLSRWTLKRLVDVGHWQRLFYGIYLTHSAKPNWVSRAQAALLMGGENSFLSHESAWYLHGLQQRPPPIITLNIPRESRLKKRPSLRIVRRSQIPATTGKLARTTPEDTLLDLIAKKNDPLDIVGLLTHAFRNNVTDSKVLEQLEKRTRFRNRKLLNLMLSTVVHGIESPLEYLFDHNVEIPHGLPRSEKQSVRRINGKQIRSDRRIKLFRLLIELDGNLGHPGGRTDRDTWRDNANLIKYGETTLRYRWANIAGRPCETAAQIAAALQANGWRGKPTPCSRHCGVLQYQM